MTPEERKQLLKKARAARDPSKLGGKRKGAGRPINPESKRQQEIVKAYKKLMRETKQMTLKAQSTIDRLEKKFNEDNPAGFKISRPITASSIAVFAEDSTGREISYGINNPAGLTYWNTKGEPKAEKLSKEDFQLLKSRLREFFRK